MADERVLDRLRQTAAARGLSLGQIIREALEEKVQREQPAVSFIGLANDRRPNDVPARRADEQDLYRPKDIRGR